jgi:hypothetical protein
MLCEQHVFRKPTILDQNSQIFRGVRVHTAKDGPYAQLMVSACRAIGQRLSKGGQSRRHLGGADSETHHPNRRLLCPDLAHFSWVCGVSLHAPFRHRNMHFTKSLRAPRHLKHVPLVVLCTLTSTRMRHQGTTLLRIATVSWAHPVSEKVAMTTKNDGLETGARSNSPEVTIAFLAEPSFWDRDNRRARHSATDTLPATKRSGTARKAP